MPVVKKKKTKATKKSFLEEPEQMPARTEDYSSRIFIGLFILLIGIFSVVTIFYTDGKIVNAFSCFIKAMLGWGYWIFGLCLIFIGLLLIFQKSKPIAFRIICLSLLPIFFSSLINIIGKFNITNSFSVLFSEGQIFNCGGVLGGSFAWMLNNYLGKVFSCILLIILLIILVFSSLGADSNTFKRAQTSDKAQLGDKLFAGHESMTNSIENEVSSIGKPFKFNLFSVNKDEEKAKTTVYSNAGKNRGSMYNVPLGEDDTSFSQSVSKRQNGRTTRRTYTTEIPESSVTNERYIKKTPITTDKVFIGSQSTASNVEDIKEPVKITKEEIHRETESVAATIAESEDSGTYEFPDVSLLKQSKFNGNDSKDQLYATQDRLESTLHSFGVMSDVVKITPGPTVTRYDIELEQGVKLTKVTNLAGDLALSLGVVNVRVAPIPDEISTVGIEVPNKIVNTVSLREIIESETFVKSKSKLTFAIGKDIGGHSIVGDISKLPHMLIAGTTGSGKSVCMNSLIISLLYKSKPNEVKFIMIDPKMVELGIYNKIPHLYVPVVTEPKKAAGALQWAVVEMLKRYKLFSEAGVRDLDTYNKCCEHSNEPTLPRVVIVIDELADLMMAASKEVEESICRVAQMGRAAGMHLIIATQRPSADVITGLMKANIPSRIAFAVSSAMESRIIMDQSGAEKLVGHGDMLYSPIGCGKPLRVQGCYVSDDEREKIVNYIKDHSDFKAQVPSELQEAINKGVEDSKSQENSNGDSKTVGSEYDEMLPQAVEVVLEMKSCSVSMLQRRLKLGYSRAARVVDQMEELGIVGPYEGAKPRSVPITREDWNQIKVKLGLATEDDIAFAAELNENTYDESTTEDENY